MAGRSTRRDDHHRRERLHPGVRAARRGPGTRRSRRHGSRRRRPTTSRSRRTAAASRSGSPRRRLRRRQRRSPASPGKGFFDHTVFHRIVPGFVIQGGDPTATGTGGPGYTTIDPPPASTRYTLGVAAMAKTASGPGRRVRQPVLRRHGARRGTAARVRGARQGRSRPARRPEDRQARRSGVGRRGDTDRDGRDREGDRSTSASAIVLAAGASTRYGGVKQRELLPFVLEALEQTSVARDRRRRGSAPARCSRRSASSAARTGTAARARRFAAGSQRSAPRSSGR